MSEDGKPKIDLSGIPLKHPADDGCICGWNDGWFGVSTACRAAACAHDGGTVPVGSSGAVLCLKCGGRL